MHNERSGELDDTRAPAGMLNPAAKASAKVAVRDMFRRLLIRYLGLLPRKTLFEAIDKVLAVGLSFQ